MGVACIAIVMARIFNYNAYSVHVYKEALHQRPHAHISHPRGGARIGSVFLVTLDYYDVTEKIPKEVKKLIEERQTELLETWEEFNDA